MPLVAWSPALGEDAADEDPSIRAYAREQLLLNARESVDPTRRESGGLDALKTTLAEKGSMWQRANRAEHALLVRLLGEPGQDGLIRQAAVLYRWMDSGLGDGQVAIELRSTNGTVRRSFPLETPNHGLLLTGTLRLVDLPEDGILSIDGISDLKRATQQWAGLVEQARAVSATNRASNAWLHPLVLAVSDAAELREPIARAWLEARQQQVAARVKIYEEDRPSKGLVSEGTVTEKGERAKRVLERAQEYELRLVAIEQALDRLARAERMLKEDAGQLGFQLEAVKRNLAGLDAKTATATKARAALVAAANAGATKAKADTQREDEPKKDASTKGVPPKDMPPKDMPPTKDAPLQPVPAKDFPAEPKKGDAPPPVEPPQSKPPVDEPAPAPDRAPEPAPKPDPELARLDRELEALAAERGGIELKLEGLQLKEIVDEQLLRVLYITVRRAALATQLIDTALSQVKSEAQAAEAAHKAFEAELSRMRRERQLDRLDYEMARLKAERERMAKAGETAEGDAKAILTAYDEALEELMSVSTVTRDAVTMRRALEARVKPDHGESDAAPAVTENERGCLPGENTDEADARHEAEAQAAKLDPLRRFRDPSPESITANFVRDASQMVERPAWDAALAANHYDVVSVRIGALDEALKLVARADSLETRFDEAREGATTALGIVSGLASKQGAAQGWWFDRVRSRRDRDLARDEKAFRETLRGIREERKVIQEDLELFRDYRDRLLRLGPRSFQIRVERTLDPEKLERAYSDTSDTVGDAGRWLTMQSEEHVGTFVARHWAKLLACLGLLVASFFVVRLGRRGLDRVLRTMANRSRVLRDEPVTVRAEEAHAKRAKALQEARAKAVEAEALREVSKEEADRQQKMGEGGYSGDDA